MASANATTNRYAGFWRRLTAYGIDSTIVQLGTFLLLYLLGNAAQAATPQETMDLLVRLGWLPAPQPGQSVNDVLLASGASGAPLFSMQDLLLMTVVSGLYHIGFTAGAWQATPGKRWCGIYCIRTDGRPFTWKMSAVRWLASGVSWLPLGLGYAMAGFTPEKTAMHDTICGTRVIYGRAPAQS